MCGRVAIRELKNLLEKRFGAGKIDLGDIFPRANVTPGSLVPAVRLEGDERIASLYLWGFLPPNAPDRGFISKYSTFNAKAESLQEKRLWPGPFKSRRCLVIASAWYEWPKAPGTKIPPCTILPSRDEAFAFAGLWGSWKDPESGDLVDTATIVTVAPNATIAALPHHRMPAILDPGGCESWLSPSASSPELLALLRPCPEDWLTVRSGGPESFSLGPASVN